MRGQFKKLLIVLLATAMVVTSMPETLLQAQAAEIAQAEKPELPEQDTGEILNADIVEVEVNDEVSVSSGDSVANFIDDSEKTFTVDTYQATASDEKIAAQEEIWRIINTYADPDYHLTDPYLYYMTDEEYAELKQVALNTTAGCKTQYEKIAAITKMVAERTYYDNTFTAGGFLAGEGAYIPYDVYTEKKTVCTGYANLMRTLFISIGIPCMNLIGFDHEYNAVYDSENDRWVFADATWCCGNVYTIDGEWITGNYRSKYFDCTPAFLATLENHEVFNVSGLLYNNLYYTLNDNPNAPAWSDMDWYLTYVGVKNDGSKAIVTGFDGYAVTGVEGSDEDFYENNTLKVLDLSATKITEIADWGLSGYKALTTLALPNTLATIGARAFYDCTSLESIDLSNTKVTELGAYAFDTCSSLTTVKLPSNLKSIGVGAFRSCKSLTGINIPGSLTYLGSSAFHYCSALKSVDLSGTKITAINNSTFYNCESLSSVKIPGTVTSIGQWAFEYCGELKTLDLSKTKITTISDAFIFCEKLSTVKFPSTLTTIGDDAFKYAALKTIDLSGTAVTSIGEDAFRECNATLIKLPSSLKKIGNYAFGARTLTDVLVVTALTEKQMGYTGNPYEEGSPWYLCNVTVTPYLYTVKFNGNGATSGSVSSMTCGANISYKLNTNKFKKTNYKFVGWNTKADGSGKTYKDGASIKNLTKTAGKTVTLYAQWEKTTYTITYNMNGGKNNSKNPSTYKKTTATITLKDPTRKGYTFKGWYSDSGFTKKVTKISKGSSGDKTLYAKWTANKYTIKFDGNGATNGTVNSLKDRKYGKSYTLPANSFKKKGYSFVGWNTKADGSGTSYENKASVKNLTASNGKTVTLYAQWKKNTYKITYKLNGGKNNSKNPSTYKVTTATITLKDPTRKGYTFKGWYSDSSFTKKVTKITKGSTGNKTLYAKWIAKDYKITYELKGGKNNKNNPSTYTIETKTITLKNPTRSGYVFKGWYSDKACTNKVTEIIKGSTGNITLYAKWSKKK